jgi:hypothetical protein
MDEKAAREIVGGFEVRVTCSCCLDVAAADVPRPLSERIEER